MTPNEFLEYVKQIATEEKLNVILFVEDNSNARESHTGMLTLTNLEFETEILALETRLEQLRFEFGRS